MPIGTRRTAYYLAIVFATTLVFTLLYNAGMAALENRPQPLYQSLEVVVQSFTTTGYGEDAAWETPWMNYLVILMQLTGIGFILAAVDVFAVPWLRDALAPTAPEAVDDVEDHVVVCGYTPRTEAFLEELDARDRPVVLVVGDADAAVDLHEAGYRVVHGDPESAKTLQNAGIEDAVAVVADVSDATNASIALAARDCDPNLRVITLLEDASLERYHRAAGATDVLSPRKLLGETLARQVPTAVTTDVDDGVAIGDDFELVELTVAEDSDLCERSFGDVALRDRFGVNVIGAWFGGDFESPVPEDAELGRGTRFLVAGEPDRLAALREETAADVRAFGPRNVVIAGFGDSGRAAYDSLSGTDSRVAVLDVEDGDAVDVVGDARDPDVLESAGVPDATGLLVTVGDDTTAIFVTLIARELNPDVHIVVRANQENDVRKLYRAGADYVQSLATVSGRMLASTVFADEDVLAVDRQVRIVRLPVGELAGRTIADADVRAETGCTVVAVIRGDETITEFDPAAFVIESGDEVVLAGTDDAVTEFERRYLD